MKTADDLFFMPGRHPGIAYLAKPWEIIRPAGGARIRQFSGSDYPEVDREIRKRFQQNWVPTSYPEVFEISSVPVVLTRAHFRRHGVTIEGRWLLSGANGDRILNRYLRRTDGRDMETEIVAALDPGEDEFQPIAVEPVDDPDVPIAITMRNGHNYYHFLTEVMPQLALIYRMKSQAPVTIHLPDAALLKPFAANYIRAIYPQLAERVRFTSEATRYARVITIYNHRHYLYQTRDPAVEAALARVPEDDAWHARSGARRSRNHVTKSSFDLGLRLLREDALHCIAGMDLSDLPRRIFVGRGHAPDSPRFRENPGQDQLLAALREEGFQEVLMERLSPHEQIAAFHAAEKVVALHGAGMANMVFARRNATIVELGNLQTQIYRWGDFFQNAHVARCRYFTVFADVDWEDPTQLPAISTGLRGALIGRQAIDRVLDIICRAPAERRDRSNSPAKEDRVATG